jgi:F-type H+-transporting ATPase subunit alpha
MLAQGAEAVVCVYGAVGQRAAALLAAAFALWARGAAGFVGFLAAEACDRPALLYLTPYSAASLSEFFMWVGQAAVFLAVDDLTKHAAVYREIHLLLGRAPGREAFPGEIFFVHSRLLERSAKLALPLGAGSVTCFPVIETLAADVSAYIPTNVISITDGQLFVSAELFVSNKRPAVELGLSVTRVGSAAQWVGVKNIAGSYKIEMAQYAELESFAQFSSDLGRETQHLASVGVALAARG